MFKTNVEFLWSNPDLSWQIVAPGSGYERKKITNRLNKDLTWVKGEELAMVVVVVVDSPPPPPSLPDAAQEHACS